MVLKYYVYVDGQLKRERTITDERASYSYLSHIEWQAKEDFSIFHNLKIKSFMDSLEISFVNNQYEFVQHKYFLIK